MKDLKAKKLQKKFYLVVAKKKAEAEKNNDEKTLFETKFLLKRLK